MSDHHSATSRRLPYTFFATLTPGRHVVTKNPITGVPNGTRMAHEDDRYLGEKKVTFASEEERQAYKKEICEIREWNSAFCDAFVDLNKRGLARLPSDDFMETTPHWYDMAELFDEALHHDINEHVVKSAALYRQFIEHPYLIDGASDTVIYAKDKRRFLDSAFEDCCAKRNIVVPDEVHPELYDVFTNEFRRSPLFDKPATLEELHTELLRCLDSAVGLYAERQEAQEKAWVVVRSPLPTDVGREIGRWLAALTYADPRVSR